MCFDDGVQHLLAIGFGGFVGALARYGGVRLVHAWSGDGFPYGTLVVNVLGSFLLGLILSFAASRPFDPDLRAALAVGFCGSFTTMSSFSFETFALLERGAFVLAAFNVAGTFAICMLSVWLGVAVARAL